MDFYLDAFLMENLLMNFAVLFIASWLMRVKPSVPRLTLAATLGAAYSCYSFLVGFGADWMLGVSKVIISFLMILIAFRYAGFKQLLKLFAAFYGSGFLMAGAILGIMFAFSIPGEVENGVICWYYNSTFLSMVMGVLTVILIVKTLLDIFRRKEVDNGLRAELLIEMGGRQITAGGFMDTGNQLRDPVTGLPVIIAEYKDMRDLFDEETQKELDTGVDDFVKALGNSGVSDIKRRFRLIPFTSIGKNYGLLPGIRIDKLYIKYNGKTKIAANTIICLSNQKLSVSGEYSAIINPDIIKNLKNVGGGMDVFKKSS